MSGKKRATSGIGATTTSSMAASVSFSVNSGSSASSSKSTMPMAKTSVRESTLPADDLLGAHVVLLADHQGALRGRVGHRARLGDAEVGELHVAVPGEQHVAWRDVAVDDVEAPSRLVDEVVGEVEGAADAADDVGGQRRRHRRARLPVAVDERAQRDARMYSIAMKYSCSHFLELVDLHDVAVHEVGRELGLVDEELQPLRLPRVAARG